MHISLYTLSKNAKLTIINWDGVFLVTVRLSQMKFSRFADPMVAPAKTISTFRDPKVFRASLPKTLPKPVVTSRLRHWLGYLF